MAKITHKTKYAMTSAAFALTVAAVIVVLNLVVSAVANRVNIEFDLTPNSIYSLTGDTKSFLETYDVDTTIYVMSSSADSDSIVSNILDKYVAASDCIEVKYINPSENPTFGRSYVATGESLEYDSIIIDGGERYKVYTLTELYSFDDEDGMLDGIDAENQITSALKYIQNGSRAAAYFVTGHGEADLSGAMEYLDYENYEVSELDLADGLPEDAGLVVIAAPAEDYTAAEVAALREYLATGGSAFFIFDAASGDAPNLYALLAEYGISVGALAVEESFSNMLMLGTGGDIICTPEVEEHDVTESLGTVAYLPYARAILSAEGANTEVLLRTSSDAHLSDDYEDLESSIDDAGSYAILTVAQNSANQSRIAVAGSTLLYSTDRSVVENRLGLANYDLLGGICRYLTRSSEETIAAKSLVSQMLTITPTAAMVVAVMLAAVPVALLAAGFVVRHRRKNL